uniref:Dimer_Tnp_hAT domain-containing protein n=1 Tax=Globodera pallida TaxID=36090 RepID=A0A183BKQ9_GLOPA
MIVDPRFAFDENVLLKDEWFEVENELIDFYRNAAQALLAIPATSVTSERLFSKAGLIYANTLRNRLSAEKVEEILQIKANLTEFPLQLQDVEDEEAPHGGVEELE